MWIAVERQTQLRVTGNFDLIFLELNRFLLNNKAYGGNHINHGK